MNSLSDAVGESFRQQVAIKQHVDPETAKRLAETASPSPAAPE